MARNQAKNSALEAGRLVSVSGQAMAASPTNLSKCRSLTTSAIAPPVSSWTMRRRRTWRSRLSLAIQWHRTYPTKRIWSSKSMGRTAVIIKSSSLLSCPTSWDWTPRGTICRHRGVHSLTLSPYQVLQAKILESIGSKWPWTRSLMSLHRDSRGPTEASLKNQVTSWHWLWILAKLKVSLRRSLSVTWQSPVLTPLYTSWLSSLSLARISPADMSNRSLSLVCPKTKWCS